MDTTQSVCTPLRFDALVLKVFQPISTAGKAPVSTTASKAPAKPTEKTTKTKAAKKTASNFWDEVSHLLTSRMSIEDAESDEDGRLGIEAIA
jgi:hypothetical protein